MKIFRFLAPALLLVAGVGVVMVSGSGNRETATAESSPEPSKSSRALVKAEPFIVHQGPLQIKVDGTVVPFREIKLSSEVAGRVLVKKDHCRAGTTVAMGTTLLQIDPADYELDLVRSENQMQQAVVNLQEVDQELANAQELIKLAEEELQLRVREVERLRQLTIGKGVSENEFDAAQRNKILAKNARQTVLNQLQVFTTRRKGLVLAQKISESQLKRVQLDLERTQVIMPVDGIVVTDQVEQGDFVQRGALLATVEDTSAVEVKCSLEMDDLYWVWSQPSQPSSAAEPLSNYSIPPTPVTIRYRMSSRGNIQYTWKGVLTRYDGIGLDERTRTVPCRVLVAEPQAVTVWEGDREVEADTVTGPRALVRGMYVTVSLEITTKQRIVQVPSAAFRVDNTIGRVRDGRYELLNSLRVVGELQKQDRKYWLMEASEEMLMTGDQVVTSATTLGLTSGMDVEIYKGTSPGTEESESQ